MNTTKGKTNQTTAISWVRPNVSGHVLATDIERMLKEADFRMDSLTVLTPISICQQIISTIDAQAPHEMTLDEAVDAAKFMMSLYPKRAFNDPENFMTAVIALFMRFDLAFVRRVVDPVDGLPGKLQFPPSVAEVKAALEEAERYRFRVRATAKWMIEENERRHKEAEEKARWNFTPEEAARRKAAVAEIMRAARSPTEHWQKTPDSHLIIPPDEEKT